MRMEKGYRHWKADLIYEHNPIELGLDRFVALEKEDFVGKNALLAEIERGPKKQFACITIDCDIASAHSGDSVYSGDDLIGTITSGGYGHRVEANIAYVLMKPEYTELGTKLSVGILGKRYQAEVCIECLYDEPHEIVRG